MSTKIKAQKAPKIKASDMFFLAVITFILMLTEPVLNSLFNMYGFGWAIALRAICIVIWAFGIKGLIGTAKKDCNFEVLEKEKPLSALQWVILSVVSAAVIGFFVWSKLGYILSSFRGLTSLRTILAFTSMILLNAFKAAVITLIIVFVQKGFSISFKAGKWIPFGGIAIGIIWAVMYILSSIENLGIGMGFNWIYVVYQFVYGLALGVIFVVSGNRVRYSFPFILVSVLLIFLS